jgi:hypothetical protein
MKRPKLVFKLMKTSFGLNAGIGSFGPVPFLKRGTLMQQLRYQTPAKSWEEGLPIGNGKLGAMIISSPARTHLQCNEDSIWYGGPRNRNNRSAKGHLQEIQHLILAGQTAAAEELMINTMTAIPEYERHYEPGGDVFIENMDRRPAMDYTRVLDLATAVADEEYVMGETRECLKIPKSCILLVKNKTECAGWLYPNVMK